MQQTGLFFKNRNARKVLQLVIVVQFDLGVNLGHQRKAPGGLGQREGRLAVQHHGFGARSEHATRFGIAGNMAGPEGQLGAKAALRRDRDEIAERVRQIALVGAGVPQLEPGQTVGRAGELIGKLLVLPRQGRDVDAAIQANDAGVFGSGVRDTGIARPRPPGLDLQGQIGAARRLPRFEHHRDMAERVLVQPVHVIQQLVGIHLLPRFQADLTVQESRRLRVGPGKIGGGQHEGRDIDLHDAAGDFLLRHGDRNQRAAVVAVKLRDVGLNGRQKLKRQRLAKVFGQQFAQRVILRRRPAVTGVYPGGSASWHQPAVIGMGIDQHKTAQRHAERGRIVRAVSEKGGAQRGDLRALKGGGRMLFNGLRGKSGHQQHGQAAGQRKRRE